MIPDTRLGAPTASKREIGAYFRVYPFPSVGIFNLSHLVYRAVLSKPRLDGLSRMAVHAGRRRRRGGKRRNGFHRRTRANTVSRRRATIDRPRTLLLTLQLYSRLSLSLSLFQSVALRGVRVEVLWFSARRPPPGRSGRRLLTWPLRGTSRETERVV